MNAAPRQSLHVRHACQPAAVEGRARREAHAADGADDLHHNVGDEHARRVRHPVHAWVVVALGLDQLGHELHGPGAHDGAEGEPLGEAGADVHSALEDHGVLHHEQHDDVEQVEDDTSCSQEVGPFGDALDHLVGLAHLGHAGLRDVCVVAAPVGVSAGTCAILAHEADDGRSEAEVPRSWRAAVCPAFVSVGDVALLQRAPDAREDLGCELALKVLVQLLQKLLEDPGKGEGSDARGQSEHCQEDLDEGPQSAASHGAPSGRALAPLCGPGAAQMWPPGGRAVRRPA
mmetsp:Transcript_17400/g.39389  ORF Transcript_17400/g.39389 Transcript_17400/m.39389 type:complete len:288 (-) Transcript_17400:7-870(-)